MKLKDSLIEALRTESAYPDGWSTIKRLCETCGTAYETIERCGHIGSLTCRKCSDEEEKQSWICFSCGRRMSRYVAIDRNGAFSEEYLSCDHCNGAASADASTRAAIMQAWERIAPADFRYLERDKLPASARLDEVLEWKQTQQHIGIFINGPSYTGKTRCVYERCRRDHIEGLTIRIFRAGDFSAEASERGGDNSLRFWREKLLRYDIVFFDDFGKERLTDRAESELFALIDSRLSERRRIYFTTNEDVRSLAAKFADPQRAAAIINRITQRCMIFTFTYPKR